METSAKGDYQMTDKILVTENVHLYYGKKEALHGIDLSFKKNDITALIGPSGSGKSTYLLHSIACMT
jgi:phosphate transport system ATP-binding protein